MAVPAVTGSSGYDYINVAQKNAAEASSQPSKEMFLQLLVAQIKNQDPMNPTQGAEFVAELAQFSQLEQTISLAENTAAIRAVLEGPGSTGKSTGENKTGK